MPCPLAKNLLLISWKQPAAYRIYMYTVFPLRNYCRMCTHKIWFCWEINVNILTSTKNASLIITDFLAMIKENEQWRTASLCRGWAMLENEFNLICRWRVIPMTSCRLNVHMTALCIDHLWFQFEFAPSLCRKCFANQRTNLDHFFKQLCLRVITLWNYDVILKTKCKVRLRNLPTFSFSFK